MTQAPGIPVQAVWRVSAKYLLDEFVAHSKRRIDMPPLVAISAIAKSISIRIKKSSAIQAEPKLVTIA